MCPSLENKDNRIFPLCREHESLVFSVLVIQANKQGLYCLTVKLTKIIQKVSGKGKVKYLIAHIL